MSVAQVREQDFEREVLSSDLPVLVEFSAEWCGPCKLVAPELKALAHDLDGKAKIVTVDIDRSPMLARQLDVLHELRKVLRDDAVAREAIPIPLLHAAIMDLHHAGASRGQPASLFINELAAPRPEPDCKIVTPVTRHITPRRADLPDEQRRIARALGRSGTLRSRRRNLRARSGNPPGLRARDTPRLVGGARQVVGFRRANS